ncbi:MAG: hypothetical protein KDD62_16395, partial [Bdellovibrionales bacterium]|nr:hypothetical protein [Bdellovibrionales bacterium]
VWVISPTVKKVGAEKNDKLREARIYLSSDARREILQITSEVFVGTVKTKLSSFQPSIRSSSSTTIAANTGKIYIQ